MTYRPNETLAQMRTMTAALCEGMEDCFMAGDRGQAAGLVHFLVTNIQATAKLRRDLKHKPEIRRARLDLTVKAVSVRAAEIHKSAEESAR